MVQPITILHLFNRLQAADQALADFEKAIRDALSDLPTTAEYHTLTDTAASLQVVRALIQDWRTRFLQLWP